MDNTNPGIDEDERPPAASSGGETARPTLSTLQPGAGRPFGPAPIASGSRFRYGAHPIEEAVRPMDPHGPPALDESGHRRSVGQAGPHPGGRARESRTSSVLIGLISGILGAVAAIGALAFGGVFDRPETVVEQITTVQPPAQIVINGSEASTTAAAVALKVVPSIVAIEVGTNDGGAGFSPFASGSGVILSEEGLIVTNHHVVEGADLARVVLQSGAIYDAEIIGTDPLTDIAVLQIDAVGLVPVELGTSTTLSIGEIAVAVGNPLGLPGGASVTVGVVSAFDREVQIGPTDTLFGMLQTDAPITRGSSGGALVDGEGKLIGITTAIGVTDAGAEGIGFAIPVELMTRITDEVIETGSVRHTFLGVSLEDTYVQEGGAQVPAGAIIVGFAEPSGAREAGIEIGDRAISINGKGVRTKEDIINELRTFRVGDSVTLIVERDAETTSIDVVLGERPSS